MISELKKVENSNFLPGFALLLLLFLWGCGDPIVIPGSDDSPPTVQLIITGVGTEVITLYEDSEPLEISGPLDLNQRILMTARAMDSDGGVKNVILRGEVVLNCVDTHLDLGLRQYQSYLADNPDDASIGEEARTVRTTAIDLPLRKLAQTCERSSGSYIITSVSGSFSATAVNFHGGTARTAVFNFNYR